MTDTNTALEALKGIKAEFSGDITSSEKALARKSCKDPAWHNLRISVRKKDVLALEQAIAALSTPHAPDQVGVVIGYAAFRDGTFEITIERDCRRLFLEGLISKAQIEESYKILPMCVYEPASMRPQPDRVAELERKVEELESEAEQASESNADRMRMIDRIADLIGLPQDRELDTTAFELWFSNNALKGGA